MAKEIDITLSSPTKYSEKGEWIEENVIIMRAPNTGSSLTRKNARRLKNLGLTALQKAKLASEGREVEDDTKSDIEDSQMKGTDLMTVLGMGGADTNEIIDAMKRLAPAVISIGETDIPFKDSQWERLSMEDEEEITGGYLINFLLNLGDSESKS